MFHEGELLLAKEALVFLFEVGGEECGADALANLLGGEEAAAVEFGAGGRGDVGDETEGVDEFALARTLEDVAGEELDVGVESGNVDTDFLAYLAIEGGEKLFAVVDVATDGGVPTVGLNVLPSGSMLEIEMPCGVEEMEMDNGVERLVDAVVGNGASGLANDVAVAVDYGEKFLEVVLHKDSFERNKGLFAEFRTPMTTIKNYIRDNLNLVYTKNQFGVH